MLRRPHREWEPLRTKLGFVHHRLGNTLTPRGREPGYADAQAMRRDLELVLAHLNSRHVALRHIRRLLWQVDVFGFHLAGIDIRQGAGMVREATAAILPGYGDADEPRRQALLTEALVSGRRGIEHDPGGEAGELLRVLDTVALSADAYGPQAVPAFVISMTEHPSDVLAATWLAQPPGATSLRMVPLFETRAALEQAPATMAELYACEPYVAHLRAQANRQTVMVGYSGLRQGHRLHRLDVGAAQRPGAAGQAGAPRRTSCSSSSTAAAARRRAAAGAPIARSWPSPRAPSTGASGSPSRARRCPPATPTRSWPSGRWSRRSAPCCWRPRCRTRRSATSGGPRWSGCRSARASATAALVYDDPEFLRFFGQVAPIAELSQLNIGSRPPSRKGVAGVESLRAIPWVFAWTQNRLLLPSWYGAGTALAAGDLELQREMWRDWPFFRGLIGTLEMALFKSDLGVAERYLSLVDEDIARALLDRPRRRSTTASSSAC